MMLEARKKPESIYGVAETLLWGHKISRTWKFEMMQLGAHRRAEYVNTRSGKLPYNLKHCITDGRQGFYLTVCCVERRICSLFV
jgi:hypothetical protein